MQFKVTLCAGLAFGNDTNTDLDERPTVVTVEESQFIHCEGLTREGDTYKVSVQYDLDPTWLDKQVPFAMNSGKSAYLSVEVLRYGEVVHADAVFSNELDVEATDHQRVYTFNKREVIRHGTPGRFVFETPITSHLTIRKSNETAEFEFVIGDAHGKFKNGKCGTSI